MRILLADDSKTVRNVQKKILQTLDNVEFVEAENGAQALQFVGSVDLVVIDWYMPVMDGITLVRRIRQVNSQLPLIMCTSETDKMRIIEAMRAGVNSYVVKPFTTEVLLEKVNAALAKTKAAA